MASKKRKTKIRKTKRSRSVKAKKKTVRRIRRKIAPLQPLDALVRAAGVVARLKIAEQIVYESDVPRADIAKYLQHMPIGKTHRAREADQGRALVLLALLARTHQTLFLETLISKRMRGIFAEKIEDAGLFGIAPFFEKHCETLPISDKLAIATQMLTLASQNETCAKELAVEARDLLLMAAKQYTQGGSLVRVLCVAIDSFVENYANEPEGKRLLSFRDLALVAQMMHDDG
ncbi:MAG: hypothetical protein JO019_01615 [Candidatus Kaiserbacteria bacterium]|nr:hypothetical protein [Candidatus Kaiserbacteria bacterium]